ncbi:type II secretion system minor pseudopilin GspI [Hirschia litorea]|uniref:Type II secretion system protein I n=1 Tax=Hirschia litorea TaxID=1199156 RepID=A0ABW2IHF9_9PROT
MRGVEFNPCDEAGFTLIEVLAALSVFAIAALGLIHVSSENTHGARAIEERMLATIVADNEMTLTLVQRTPLEVGVSTGRTVVGGRDWEWRKTISTTPNPLIQQVKIEAWVYDEGFEGEQSVNVSLTAFKGKTS